MKLSGLARSTYYYYLKNQETDKYKCEKQEIQTIFNVNKGRYGYRRITVAMRNKGYVINHKTVLKLMNSLGLKGKQRKNDKYHSYKGTVGKVADNLLKRDFYAERPFEKITTDVTQFKIGDEKVYLSPVMDLFNREIISYSISTSPNLWQIREMLAGLFEKLPADATPIFHSDQGWQYQHAEYQRLLAEHNITQSMSRKGNCMDNGAIENFFGRFKVEMFYGEKFESVNTFIDELKLQIKTSTALAIGAVLGGLVGKWLFELVKNGFGNERVLGAVQAVFLTLITIGVFLYVCNKDKLPSKNVKNIFAAVIIGIFLGIISSFLGIGGGTSNVAVLFFFFSMEAKEAAKNSLYIIIFSQISSIVTALMTGSVPDFEWIHLLCMVIGGIGGALTGAAISKRIDNKGVEKILKALLIVIIMIDFYNVLKFTIL